MYSASSLALVAAAAIAAASAALGVGEAAPLRVCADPNNMPYSNARGEGFENALAQLVATELHRRVEYTWWPQRRGFLRNTLQAGACDLVMGVPADLGGVLTTRPYYRSSYVFVVRRDALADEAFNPKHLRRLRIGVPAIGAASSAPPVQALTERGLAANLHAYSVYGDYSQPYPGSALIDAVARGEVDVALTWGPPAGYFARRQPVQLDIVAAPADFDTARTPMAFDIAIGVRQDAAHLKKELDDVLVRRRAAILGLLLSYGVPLLDDNLPPLAFTP